MQHRLVAARVGAGSPAMWLAVAAWLVILGLALTGNGAIVRHDRLLQGGPPLWWATLVFVAGWQVMVWAMMAPASLHAFARVPPGRAAVLFALGYVAVWTVFGLTVFFADAGVHAAVRAWPWLAERPWLIAGAVVVFAGAYQLSELKSRSLDACRHVPRLAAGGGSAREGLRHGLDCVGASGGLMLVAFALAMSNPLTMAAIAMFMVCELVEAARPMVRAVGYALIALGVVVLAGPIQLPFALPT